MDRRSFFTRGAGKVAEKVTEHTAEIARKNSSRWIRPPFAIEELDLLLACCRCNDCVEACPHNIIFPLPANLGVKVFSTPAMDLINHGCHLCEGWPCVQACEKGALKIPETINNGSSEDLQPKNTTTEIDKKNENYEENKQRQLPKIATISINTKTCLPYSGPECGACHVCPIEDAMIWSMEKPEINIDLCTGCALCREACIIEPKAINVQSKYKS